MLQADQCGEYCKHGAPCVQLIYFMRPYYIYVVIPLSGWTFRVLGNIGKRCSTGCSSFNLDALKSGQMMGMKDQKEKEIERKMEKSLEIKQVFFSPECDYLSL